jgi:hypothetical protein
MLEIIGAGQKRQDDRSMWFADVYCDLTWVAQCEGILGPPRFSLRGPKSVSLDIAIEFRFYGDEGQVRHVRVLMDTGDQRKAERCVDLNIQTWVAALEVAVIMETRSPFHVVWLPNPQMIGIALGQGEEDAPALIIKPIDALPERLSYERLAHGIAAWSGEVHHHLFYFRRFVDDSLPLDVRWLNGYRLLEWQFVKERSGLAKSLAWREFVQRFAAVLAPQARPKQTLVGLIEEARALAAHAGTDDRSIEDRQADPHNAMEKTFRALEAMVMTVLNEHPARIGNPVSFKPRTPNT